MSSGLSEYPRTWWRRLLDWLGWWRLPASPALEAGAPKLDSHDPTERQLYGRDELLAAVGRDRSHVLVVAGDPGVGKSELIARASAQSSGLAPQPVTVAYRPGSLQTSLLEALGAALAEHIASQRSVDRVAALINEASARVGQARLDSVAAGAAAFMFAVARDKLGDTAVDLAQDFAKAVSTTLDEQLTKRITQAADADALEVFRALAAEACSLVGAPVVLALDAVEKLHDDDFAHLRDLVAALPEGLCLRLGHATVDEAAAKRVRDLRVEGAHILEVKPLDDLAVREWLSAENVTLEEFDGIVRTTMGYPLFVNAAIGHVKNGGSVSELRGASAFVGQMGNNFHSLASEEQRACVVLAAFAEPPPSGEIPDALKITVDEWLVLEGRLIERRILPTLVNGDPWFHELGRRAIWHEAMSPSQRELSATRAVESILQAVTDRGASSIQNAVDLARLLPDAVTHAGTLEGVPECLSFSTDELAVYAALLELTESQQPGLDAHSVLAHARETFQRQGNLEEALRRLHELELLVIAENRDAAVVVGRWPSLAARLFVQGRATTTFGRALVPAVASTIFGQLVSPRVERRFRTAAFGVGAPSWVELSRTLRELDTERDGDAITMNRWFGVMARGIWGKVAFHLAMNFKSIDERDLALDRLRNFSVTGFFGGDFEITKISPWPTPEPLPVFRYIDAAELCSPVSPSFKGSIRYDAALGPEVASVRENLSLRLTMREVMASVATDIELDILDLDSPKGYVFFEEEKRCVVVEVVGLDEVREIEPLSEMSRPFARVRIADAAGLSHEQRIGKIVEHYGSRLVDPVAALLDEACKTMRSFNSQQRYPKDILELSQAALQEAIMKALNERTNVAKEFLRAGLIADGDMSKLHSHLRVLVYPGKERDGWVAGAQGAITWSSEPAQDNRVDLTIADAKVPPRWSEEDFERSFRLSDGRPFCGTHSTLISGIESLLSFDSGSVRLVMPNPPPSLSSGPTTS